MTTMSHGQTGAPPGGLPATLLEEQYDRLRKLARRYLRHLERSRTMQPTGLLHDTLLRLGQHDREYTRNSVGFFQFLATAMKFTLKDYLRARGRAVRGGKMHRVSFNEEIEPPKKDVVRDALQDALDDLRETNPRLSQVVENRFYGGMTNKEVASVLGLSERTVRNDWVIASAWLRSYLGTPGADE